MTILTTQYESKKIAFNVAFIFAQALKADMDSAEVGHLIGFIALLILCLVYIFLGKSWKLILVIFISNIFLNLYLVFLQQYNKRRVNRFLNFLRRHK